MWIIGIFFVIILFVIILVLMTSKTSENKEETEKRIYAMPPQRRYPCFYFKDCIFYADGSSRFAHSDDEIENLVTSLEESFNRTDYERTIKLANELVKIVPKLDKVWIKKINSIFLEVMQKEDPWKASYSKMILNSCYGFLQCYDNTLEKSIAARHILLPVILKNTEDLIKYHKEKITKYHNFEVYNMLLNMYHIIPYKEILGLMSNKILEDKTDRDFDVDNYARQTLKNLLGQVDMLRTRHTSRLQETFDSKKITNCTLITDDRITATIVAFELTFEQGVTKETIMASFFDETGKEIIFSETGKNQFVDIFSTNTDRGVTVKEEIVLLTDIHIDKVKLKIYDESMENPKTDAKEIKKSDEESTELKKSDEEKKSEKSNDKEENISDIEQNQQETDDESDSIEGINGAKNVVQTLVYPCFDSITDIRVSDTQFVALKENGTVIGVSILNNLSQISTWENIARIYVKNDAVFGVREDGSVIYSGKCDYENAEGIYGWENIESLSIGEKHLVGLTKNATVCAIGSNNNGECDVSDWYDVIQVETSYHTIGLAKDGTVMATGENNFGECDVKAWKDIVQIAVGDFYTLGLTASGKVLSAGLNSCGQCNVSEWANIKKIYASGNMSIGLRYDGKVVTAGKNSYYYDDIKRWGRIKDIVVSNNRIIGIEQDGTVHATGKPYKNFANEAWNDVKSVVINSNNIIGLKENGTIVSNMLVFGHLLSNSFEGMAQVDEELISNKIATLSDKGVLTIVNKSEGFITADPFPTLYDIKKFDMDAEYLVALKNDGTALYINFNNKAIVNISDWDNIIDVKAGNGFIMGLNISGRVMLMSTTEYSKYDVSDWCDIVKIGAAGKRAIGLTIDGKLRMTGASEFSEEDFIKILKNVKDFAITGLQTMILESDGTVKVTYHPNGVGTESVNSWKNIKKVVARGENFIGLTVDGKVYSTIGDEMEICKWEDVEDIDASASYVWATLKS